MADLDLEGIRVKFPFLQEFSDIFVRSQPLDTLLRMETTSIKVHEFEKSKAASSRLAANRDKISSTFTSVVAGRDNQIPARGRLHCRETVAVCQGCTGGGGHDSDWDIQHGCSRAGRVCLQERLV